MAEHSVDVTEQHKKERAYFESKRKPPLEIPQPELSYSNCGEPTMSFGCAVAVGVVPIAVIFLVGYLVSL